MRAIWKGALSFGLVNIPIRMYTASREKELSFVLLHKKDLSEVRYARICKAEGKEIPWSEIVKGYEYEKGDFVVLQDSDFEKVNQKITKSIEIVSFIDEAEVDSIYYVKPYFLEPDKSDKAYSLLRDALKKSKKVGLAKYILRNREHLAVVKVRKNLLILNELRYQNELVVPTDLKIPDSDKVSTKEVSIAIQLIDQLTVAFDPSEYRDTYSEDLKKMIKQKAKGKPVHPKTEAQQPSTKIHDIMSLLQASLETKKKPQKKPRKLA
jgi:DNA end-binding protein Ku